MAAPTAEEIAERSKVDFDTLGFGDEDDLQRLVDLAVSMVGRWTGQTWTDTGVYSDWPPGAGTEPMAQHIVMQLVEYLAYRSQEDVVETLADFDLISSFTAGSYSETRRGGKDAQEASRAILGNLLWPLMSYDKQDEWTQMIGGINAPAFAVTEVDWSGMGEMGSLGYFARDPLPDDPYPPIVD